ncbi:MAG: hypothetical protein ACRDTT_22865 [Pseudonocardiaceae bacterium]
MAAHAEQCDQVPLPNEFIDRPDEDVFDAAEPVGGISNHGGAIVPMQLTAV